MISIVLPYWQRQKVANTALALMAKQYPELDLEIIIVDDGDPVPFVAPSGLPWPVRVLRLPTKQGPLNPCVPINRGVAIANGEFIALSGPEMIHVKPVLAEMRAEIESSGEDTYVLAAVWYAEAKVWHVHSSLCAQSVVGVPMPAGSHYHFMSMMSRSLWDRAGGLDEDYREGTGYDDPDFVKRLERAGARFVLRDDLVVEHVRRGAHAAWTKEMFERNKQIFRSKWAQ